MDCGHGYVDPDDCATCSRRDLGRSIADGVAEQLRDVLAPPMDPELRAQLVECAEQLKATIDARYAEWQKAQEADSPEWYDYAKGVPFWTLLDVNGRPLLGDVLAARAQLLVALARQP